MTQLNSKNINKARPTSSYASNLNLPQGALNVRLSGSHIREKSPHLTLANGSTLQVSSGLTLNPQ